MKLKLLITAAIILVASQPVFAQNHIDALRYSRNFYEADARAAAIGNAFGAAGANFISSSINPAGLALFRNSNLSVSPGININSSTASYLGTSDSRSKSAFNIGSIGYTYTYLGTNFGVPRTEGLISYSFSAGINRVNSYHNRTLIEGNNTTSTILESFAENATGFHPDQLSVYTVSGMAWDTYLIDQEGNSNRYIPAMTDISNIHVNQRKTIDSRGSLTDLNFSFAGNVSNQFYFGATLGLPFANYHETSEFREENHNTNDRYSNMMFRESISARGLGIKAILGIILRPQEHYRFGISVHTPSSIGFSETTHREMHSEVDGEFRVAEPFPLEFNYRVVTPFKAILSGTYFIEQSGLVSADYEFIDYSNAFLRSSEYDYAFENETITDVYRPVHNLRLGTEWRHGNIYYRGGLSLHGSPFQKAIEFPENARDAVQIFSAGIGYRQKDYYVDFTTQYFNTKSFHQPYSLRHKNVEGSVIRQSQVNLLLTFGFLF